MEEEENKSRVSRRDFLKYSAGVAAVAAGAAAALGKIPLPTGDNKAKPATVPDDSEPLVVSVQGEELTVMTAQGEVKVRDPSLAAAIAEKAQLETRQE